MISLRSHTVSGELSSRLRISHREGSQTPSPQMDAVKRNSSNNTNWILFFFQNAEMRAQLEPLKTIAPSSHHNSNTWFSCGTERMPALWSRLWQYQRDTNLMDSFQKPRIQSCRYSSLEEWSEAKSSKEAMCSCLMSWERQRDWMAPDLRLSMIILTLLQLSRSLRRTKQFIYLSGSSHKMWYTSNSRRIKMAALKS